MNYRGLKTNPRVLVLLAAYNGQTWIGQQIDSVLAQIGVDLEILVSNDASTDGTLAIVQAAATRDPRVRWIRQPGRSGSAAGNFIRLLADADAHSFAYVALCDQDDTWLATKLQAACLHLEQAGGGLYSAATLARWPDGNSSVLRQCERTTPVDFLFEGGGQGCTFVMSVPLFAKVQAFVRAHRGMLTPMHYHDWLIYALARVWAFPWVHDPKPCLTYRQHASNDTGARTGATGRHRRIALIRSGWYADQVRRTIQICLAAGTPPEVERVERLMAAAGSSFSSRARWALYLLRYGRRRLSDRVVLFVSACCGFL